MDRPMFLDHTSGGIVSPAGGNRSSKYQWPFDIVPYFEEVRLPVLTVNSSAPYGDRPEELVTLATPTVNALTFFVDSVAGGSDTSGNGSFDDPWRSLETANVFLNCASCMITAAAPYIQVKVKGTVDYLGGAWGYPSTAPTHLILAGWGGRCDLSPSSRTIYGAQYIFDAKVDQYMGNLTIYSGCELLHYGDSEFAHYASAIDCELLSAAPGLEVLGCAYNCSGAFIPARICWGGSCSSAAANHIYGTVIHANAAVSGSEFRRTLLTLGNAVDPSPFTAVSVGISATVTLSAGSGYSYLGVTGIAHERSGFLRDCTVDIAASGSAAGGHITVGVVAADGAVVSGGSFRAAASAYSFDADPVSGYADAYAAAEVFGNGGTAVYGAATVLSASADAGIAAPDGSAFIEERLFKLGSGCSRYVQKYCRGGSETVIVSSGGVCP